jgi:glycosyltransferase involved in cell wall biosynthesis
MKILYIHQHFSTKYGATGSRSYELARRLIEKGHSVTIVCGTYSVANTGLDGDFVKGKREGVVDGINVIEYYIPYSNKKSFYSRIHSFVSFIFRSSKEVISQDYDIAYVTSTPLTVAIPALVSKFLKRKPYIFEVRDLWPQLPQVLGIIKNRFLLKILYRLEKVAYINAVACVGLSPGIVDGIYKAGGQEPIMMIPNSCDIELFSGADCEDEKLEEYKNHFIALYSGTHGFANGLSILVRTAEILKDKAPEIRLLLVGDGKEKISLIDEAKSKGLNNIIFWNPMNKEELAKLMHSCDVGLQVLKNIPEFYYGTSPNKFFDYISSGLPVVCNYPGWVADIISDNSCGSSVAPDSPEELAYTLIKLSENPEQLKEMSVNAHKVAKEQFDRDLTVTPLLDYLDKYRG